MPKEKEYPFIEGKIDFKIEIELINCDRLMKHIDEFVNLTAKSTSKFLSKYDLDSKLPREMGIFELYMGLRATRLELIDQDKNRSRK